MSNNTAAPLSSGNSDAFPCIYCGTLVWSSQPHTCCGSVTVRASSWPTQPIALYTIHCCPACQGRGSHPAGFYTPGLPATDTAPEVCRTCDGKSILKVGVTGTVEKVD